ncbi:MAG TPA: ATP-dependent protease subunit HslV [Firmicutes bacterium]|nr:MAG: HslU--HslV peptidase proteolytic subunit [Candidatus Coatesbacteria bacterium]RLC45003.1 MAG: HslU--HslV peptidase proteolytic subunit [Candidatus Coatesbacteria bacterium]HEC79961.1 ATP-dependent protease subunit HslV [Bacillota bacterium]
MERYSNLKYIQTTVIAVRKDDCVAMGGDGQVTVGDSVVKTTTRKVRKLAEGRVLAGFAGAAADALTLFEKFEAKIKEFPENLPRASVELAKEWRTDKILRRLEALLAVADREHSLLVSGSGDVIEPDDGILAIGSGGDYALSAARALLKHTNLPADEIVKESLMIASEICIYSNDKITIEVL